MNGNAVRTNNTSGKLLELGRTKASAILKCFHNIVLTAVWRQEEVVPQ